QVAGVAHAQGAGAGHRHSVVLEDLGAALTPMPVYRLTAQTYADHAYTLSIAERDAAQSQYGYLPEGTAFQLYAGPTPGAVPVYRLVNGGGVHIITWSADERRSAVGSYGFTYEGVIAYAPFDASGGAGPVYRLRGARGDYVYTM